MAEREIITIIHKFLLELKKQGVVVSDAYLFGSYAKGNPHRYSDIDLAIICQPFAEDEIEQNMVMWRIAVGIDPRIAPISLSIGDLEKEYIPIIPEIKKGISVFNFAA